MNKNAHQRKNVKVHDEHQKNKSKFINVIIK
jgi:hypothetical protein